MPKCGAPTKKGTKCRNSVTGKCKRCRWHRESNEEDSCCALSRQADTTCSICFEEITSDARELVGCGHSFHGGCVSQWFVRCAQHGDGSATCPLCRDVVSDRATLLWIDLHTTEEDSDDDDWQPSSAWHRVTARAVAGRRREMRRGLLQHIRGLYHRMMQQQTTVE